MLLKKRQRVIVNGDRGLIVLLEELNQMGIRSNLRIAKIEDEEVKWAVSFNANVDEIANLKATVKYCPKFLNLVCTI